MCLERWALFSLMTAFTGAHLVGCFRVGCEGYLNKSVTVEHMVWEHGWMGPSSVSSLFYFYEEVRKNSD